jgi:cytochrome c oxidase accessory protein FixG
VLWPQDIYLLTGAADPGAVSLFLVTSLFGRVWCGYTCPQTVWTDLFMWVERWIEGDRNDAHEARRRPPGLSTKSGARRSSTRLARHRVLDRRRLDHVLRRRADRGRGILDRPRLAEVYAMTALFTATTYLLAGWAREQVCTYMCPWPRFQSAMLDEQSLIVTYQGWRGEPRGHGKRTGAALGDCIDCSACVHVCPTGIDIRDGLQLECIGCGLCIDACNHVMEKTDRRPG